MEASSKKWLTAALAAAICAGGWTSVWAESHVSPASTNGSLSEADAERKSVTALSDLAETDSDAQMLSEDFPVLYAADFTIDDLAKSGVRPGRAINSTAMAIGDSSKATGNRSTALGAESQATGNDGTSVGNDSIASGLNSTAIGSGSRAEKAWSTALGKSSQATGDWNTAIGGNSQATGDQYSTAVGQESRATANESTAVGANSTASGRASVVVGMGGSAEGQYGTTAGYYSKATAQYSTAYGSNSSAEGEDSTALGAMSKVTALFGTGIGAKATATATGGTAAGYFSEATAAYSTAYGSDSHALAAGSVALGYKSYAAEADILGTDDSTYGVVSVGKSGTSGTKAITRRIINVRDGVNASDAATVGQIRSAIGMTADENGTYSLTIGDTTYSSVAAAIEAVSTGDGTGTTEDAVTYNDDGTLSAGKENTGKLNLNTDGSASLISNHDNKNGFTAGEDGANTIQGNTTINGGLTVTGDFKVNGETIVTNGAIDTIKDKLGTGIFINEKETYTDAINQNTSSITKLNTTVGSGELKNNAADLTSGINTNYGLIQQNSNAIGELGRSVNKLGGEIDSVGAISAALAGLHPLSYGGDGSKWELAAAMGTYDGTQAMALGGFYHVSEDVMLSLGGSTSFGGDRKTAGNIGVTFRVGQGSSGSGTGNAALKQELADVKADNAALSKKVDDLEEQMKALLAMMPAK